jgi:hypothetical protein
MFNPEVGIRHLKAEFEQAKAEIWADANMPVEEKVPAVERTWREFDRQRRELRDASQVEALEQEEHPSPGRNLAAFLPRRKRPPWK